MSLERRLLLLDQAQLSHAWIVEDDYDSEFRFLGRPISSLQGLCPHNVIYVGTFSKTMFPSLRLGYVVVPQELVEPFSICRRATDFCPPFLTQSAMNEFIIDGHFSRHLRSMRSLYAERQSAMISALQQEFGPVLQLSNTDTGVDVVAWLPEPVNDKKACELASKNGILAMPMSAFYSTVSSRSGLFLGFGTVNSEQICRGVRELRRCLDGILNTR